MKFTASLGLFALASMACSSQPPSASITQTNLVSEMAKALCVSIMACEDTWGTVAESNSSCVALMTVRLSVNSKFNLHADSTRYALDSAKAKECVDSIRAAGCGDIDQIFSSASCEQMATGILEAGECCDGGAGCKPGTYCSDLGSAVCTAFAQRDEDCTSTLCAPGLACKTDGADIYCTDPAELNQECIDVACSAGLYCSGGDYLCTPQVALGAECDTSNQCPKGAWCSHTSYTCVDGSMSNRKKIGEACDAQSNECGDYIFNAACVENKSEEFVCTKAPLLDEECDEGLQCPFFLGLECVEGTCQRYPLVGESCDMFCHSFFFNYCHIDANDLAAGGECKPRVASGEPCDSDAAAVDGELFSACTYDSGCIDDVCVSYQSMLCVDIVQ